MTRPALCQAQERTCVLRAPCPGPTLVPGGGLSLPVGSGDSEEHKQQGAGCGDFNRRAKSGIGTQGDRSEQHEHTETATTTVLSPHVLLKRTTV